MARRLFERQGVRGRSGALASGVVFAVYTDAGGTTLADIAATSGGGSIAGSLVTVADIAGLGPAALRFYGPSDGSDTLWLLSVADPSLGLQKIEADTDERLDALEGAGGVDLTAYAKKPSLGDRVFYVSRANGNDSNDGFSWGTAKRTIQAALDASDRACTIYIAGGDYSEHISIIRDGVKLVGNANEANGTRVKPITTSGTVVDVAGDGCVLEDINVLAQLTDFDGIGFNLNNAHATKLVRCRYKGYDGLSTATTGGTGLKMENCEGCLVDSFYSSEARIAINLVNEVSENVFLNIKGSKNWKEWVIEGNCGTNTIVFTKWNNPSSVATSTADTSFYQNEIGGNGQVWIVADWTEEGNPNRTRALISSDQNYFIRLIGSPQNIMTVSGNENVFDGLRIQRQVIVTGARNRFRQPILVGGTGQINLDCSAATDTVIDDPLPQGSTTLAQLAFGTSTGPARRAVGAALATNATKGFLYIPTSPGGPTGTPAAETGLVPLVFDTVNNRLNIYNSSAWRAAGVANSTGAVPVAAMTAPSAPASGSLLYVDVADSKTKIIKADGTITVLD
jgi:hypothetical protein